MLHDAPPQQKVRSRAALFILPGDNAGTRESTGHMKCSFTIKNGKLEKRLPPCVSAEDFLNPDQFATQPLESCFVVDSGRVCWSPARSYSRTQLARAANLDTPPIKQEHMIMLTPERTPQRHGTFRCQMSPSVSHFVPYTTPTATPFGTPERFMSDRAVFGSPFVAADSIFPF
jgi:hypothetical protein